MAKLERIIRKAESNIDKLQDIPLSKIIEVKNVRSDYQNIEELADSIKNYGLLQPIVVKKINDEEYELIAGHRRIRAFKYLVEADNVSYVNIPAIVKNNLEDLTENQLIENIQRENLKDSDIENAIVILLENGKIKQNELAEKIGKSPAWVSKNITAHEERKRLELEKVAPAKVFDIPTGTMAEFSTLPDNVKEDLLSNNDDKISRGKIREAKQSQKKTTDKTPEHPKNKNQDMSDFTADNNILKSKIEKVLKGLKDYYHFGKVNIEIQFTKKKSYSTDSTFYINEKEFSEEFESAFIKIYTDYLLEYYASCRNKNLNAEIKWLKDFLWTMIYDAGLGKQIKKLK